MITIICVKNIRTNVCDFFESVESLFQNMQGIMRYTSAGSELASMEWVGSELMENGVASIHTIKSAYVVCGMEFPSEVSDFVVSYIDVK